MVFLSPPNPSLKSRSYGEAYHSILLQHRRSPMTSASSVVILVAPDVDALCASKMLANLFKQDDVLHRLIPISGMAELESWRRELQSYKELHTLILLNMGAILDLPSEEWFGFPGSTLAVHIIDSNRPQNLSTLFGCGHPEIDSHVILWDDGGADGMLEERKAWESILYEPEPEDSDSDDELELKSSDIDEPLDNEFEEGASSNKRRLAPGDSPQPLKRLRRDNNERAANRVARENRMRNERIIAKHYASGTWYGQSVASTVYTLASILERVDNEMLWLAIVGLTYQFTTARISRSKYDQYQQLYDDEVVRLNPKPAIADSASLSPEFEGIRSSPELRFTLLRHWTLYDAMIHSSYVANKLAIWKERGRRKLDGLFAKMGYSIPDAQQTYQRISVKGREELNGRLDQIAPEYGLIDLTYPSFTRHFGYQRHPIGAADMVEGLSALLDVGGRVKLAVEVTGSRNGGEWFGGGKAWEVEASWRDAPSNTGNVQKGQDDGHSDGESKRPLDWWVRNFWAAYDALSEPKHIYDALFLSMSVHRAIIREGCSIIDKQQVRTMNRHRVVVLTQGPDLELLAQPGTLSRLALWLVDAHRDRIQGTHFGRSKRKCHPFVVACLNEKAGSYLVVGVTAALEYGDVRKNPFGLAFLDAKERCNARTRHGSFDTSVLEVKQADLPMFLQALCNES